VGVSSQSAASSGRLLTPAALAHRGLPSVAASLTVTARKPYLWTVQANNEGFGGRVSGGRSYRLKSPEVIEESVDGEALIVNLLTGSYYSCEGSAEAAWRMALQGISVARIADVLCQRYDAPPDVIRDSVLEFLEELETEGLVAPADGGSEPVAEGEEKPVAGKQKFEPLRLQKFSELQDLLLLDPIHDVAGSGWPTPKQDP
jgi:hypothetical protein